MAKNFSKFLGKIALMTAATLWAACNDSDKKAEDPKSDTKSIVNPIKLKKGELSKIYRDSIPVKTLKPDLGGFMQNQTVALYGVLPDVVCESCPRGFVPRCRINPLSAKNVVVEGRDIDVQAFLKVYRQRVPGLRFVCNKYIRNRSDSANEFAGKIVVTLKIASGGEVEKVEITSTTIDENSPFSAMNEEIKESVSRWIFPKTQRGGTFTFPVNLYEVIPSAASSASEQPLSPTE
jgi:hypothetical protein